GEGGGGRGGYFLVGCGVFFPGAAFAVRFQSRALPYLSRLPRRQIVLALGVFYALLGTIVTAALVSSFFNLPTLGWKPGQLVLLWFVVVPMCGTAAAACLGGAKDGTITRGEEASALLLTAGLTCFVAHRALYREADPFEADRLRWVLATMVLVTLVAAPLVVVPQTVRRAVVSGLVLLHFGGICMASLAAPPYPWLVAQLWTRIYRPYLEFMYLNNAY